MNSTWLWLNGQPAWRKFLSRCREVARREVAAGEQNFENNFLNLKKVKWSNWQNIIWGPVVGRWEVGGVCVEVATGRETAASCRGKLQPGEALQPSAGKAHQRIDLVFNNSKWKWTEREYHLRSGPMSESSMAAVGSPLCARPSLKRFHQLWQVQVMPPTSIW